MASSAPAQNLFVSDSARGNVDEYPPGAQSPFASGLAYPEGLAFDRAGNLFVASLFDGTITKIAPGGMQSPFASGLASPFGLAFNSAGNLFAADSSTDTIYEYTPGGARSVFASGLSNSSPYGLAFNSAGNLFVTAAGGGAGSGSIYELTPGGAQSTFASGLSSPYDLAFDSAGNLFVANDGNGTINEYTPNGILIRTFSTPSSGVWGLAFDRAGNLYVSDAGNNIYEYTPSEIATNGAPSTFASDLFTATYMAFQPVPEPSTLGLLAVGATAFLVRRRRRAIISAAAPKPVLSPHRIIPGKPAQSLPKAC